MPNQHRVRPVLKLDEVIKDCIKPLQKSDIGLKESWRNCRTIHICSSFLVALVRGHSLPLNAGPQQELIVVIERQNLSAKTSLSLVCSVACNIFSLTNLTNTSATTRSASDIQVHTWHLFSVMSSRQHSLRHLLTAKHPSPSPCTSTGDKKW
ncbi:hypothetical protein J6590_038568 [Homalodisca vitripennis]|nr:hypothetical protein J6590_038568 [Homalodisca vitripennis]